MLLWLQVHAPFGRMPKHVSLYINLVIKPLDVPQAHASEGTAFSVWAFSQLQCMADCLPQEHLASAAQTQPAPPERWQQFCFNIDQSQLRVPRTSMTYLGHSTCHF